MDESFFQTLRQIQKKERTNASLARVGPDFYKQVHSYINKLKRSVGNDPFADEHYLLKDSQRIATEICERREHKITDAAVMNIHRSYHLFSKSNPEFDLLDTTPLNLTPEEETLYFSLIDILREHRSKISLDKFGDIKEEDLSMKKQPITNPFVDEEDEEMSVSKSEELKKYQGHSDAILSKLNEIKNAKIIDDEKPESIEKQIANQKYPKLESKIESTPKEEIKAQFELLKEAVKAEGLKIDLYLGQEILYTSRENILAMLDEGKLLTINDSKYVLIEFCFNHRPDDFEDVVYRFNLHKYHPIIAHIERYKWMTIEDLQMLRNFECSFQINANALIGKDGCKQKRLCKKYLKHGYVDFIASDMHYFRPSNLGKALKKVKNVEYFTKGETLIENK